MINNTDLTLFEGQRPRLLGLAYRILGTRSEAEDAVQDTFLKWQKADRDDIENGAAWLTTVCTRRCLDLARAAHRTRVDYVGQWLPEPIHTADDNDAESQLDLANSLTTAFLLMLERLTLKERAAYLLHDIFDISYSEVAETLHIQEAACRKLVSRAKANIDQTRVRHTTPIERQEQLLAAFQTAVRKGETEPLASLLSHDIQLSADGGGKVPALRETILGQERVLRFVARRLHRYWAEFQWESAHINAGRGAIVKQDGVPQGIISFAFDETGLATHIYIMRNPDKLADLSTVNLH